MIRPDPRGLASALERLTDATLRAELGDSGQVPCR